MQLCQWEKVRRNLSGGFLTKYIMKAKRILAFPPPQKNECENQFKKSKFIKVLMILKSAED